MTDVVACFKAILDGGWSLLAKTNVPGLDFSYGVLLVGLALIPLGFRLLSIALGFSFGSKSDSDGYGTRGSRKHTISDSRKNDVR